MIRRAAFCGLATWFAIAGASRGASVILELESPHVGGFFVDSASNLAHVQNYFVGYGTTPGFPRSTERRNFFLFPLPEIAGTVHSATLHLALPFGGLIFGIPPGPLPMPGDPPPGKDPFESYQLTSVHHPGHEVIDPAMPLETIGEIFDTIKHAPPTADMVVFGVDGAPPPGSFPTSYGMEVVIPLNGHGISLIQAAIGADIVLTGWMPSWSFDDRLAPPGAPVEFFEASELIFGLTDVLTGAIPKPKLVIEYVPIPEPDAAILAILGCIGLAIHAARRKAPATR